MHQEVQGQPATTTDLIPGAVIQLWRWNGERSVIYAELTITTPAALEVFGAGRAIMVGQHDDCDQDGCTHYQAFCIDDWAPPGIATGFSGISLVQAAPALVAVADAA